MNLRLRRLAVLVAALMVFVAMALPASATVHEITGMLCSFKAQGDNFAVFNPPGITGENGESEQGEVNLAKPLFASGFATFDPTGGPGGEALISLDEDHPASKIELTGEIVPLEEGVWVTDFTFTKGAWQNCFG
jgi:hypothetical protein